MARVEPIEACEHYLRHFRQFWSWSRTDWSWTSGKTGRNRVSFTRSRAAVQLQHVDPSNTHCEFVTAARFYVYQSLSFCFRFVFLCCIIMEESSCLFRKTVANPFLLNIFFSNVICSEQNSYPFIVLTLCVLKKVIELNGPMIC